MPSMPPQNQPEPDAQPSPTEGARRNPLGFADVRASEPVEPSAVSAVGFAPRDARDPGTAPHAPAYRTEISFRRDVSHSFVRAESAPHGDDAASQGDDLGLGQAVPLSFEHEPVAVDDEPLSTAAPAGPAAADERVPFYKREISFGRKRESAPAAPAPAVEAAADDAVPFFKREISFGRKRDADQTPSEAVPAGEERVPFYKREIGLGRRRESATPDLPAIDAEPAPAPAPAVAEAGEAVPFFKRELSFRRRRATVGDELPAEETPVADLTLVSTDDEAVDVAEPAPLAAAEAWPPEAAAWPVTEPGEPMPADRVDAADRLPSIDEPVPAGEPVAEPVVELEPVAVEPTVDPTVDPLPVVELPVEDVPVELPVAGAAEASAVDAIPDGLDPTPEAGESVADAAEDESEATREDDAMPAAAAETRPAGRRSVRLGARGTRTPKPGRSGGRSRGRTRRFVGLKIGASQVAAAVVSEHNGTMELLRVVRAPLPPGIVVGGEIKDVQALAGELGRLFDENELPRTNVRLGVASNRIGVRTFDIEGIDDPERFDNAVRFKAHEVLPVAFHESVLDYRVVAERPTETGESIKTVLLVVAPRDQVEPYIQVCAKASIRLAAIDLEALGLLRALVEPQPVGSRVGDDTATVLVSLGHDATSLLVAGAGVCDFTRVFDWGGGLLENAISTELDVSRERAAEILRHLSLEGPGRELDGLSADDRATATRVVRSRLTPFARELVSSLHFYQTQPDSLGIGEILITGGTSHLDGLAAELHKLIGVAVRHGDPLARVIAVEAPDDDLVRRIGSVTVPIGLAIDDAPWRTVNLLPAELRPARRRRLNPVQVAVPAVAVASLAALGLLFVNAHGKVTDQQERLDAVQAEIAALPEPKRPTIDPALQGIEAARAQAVAQVLGGRLAWERLFGDVALVLPANVWLESFTADATNAVAQTAAVPVAPGTPEAAPSAVRLQGYTFSQPGVALLLARLQAMPSLARVTLESAESSAQAGKTVIKFSIVADLNGGTQ